LLLLLFVVVAHIFMFRRRDLFFFFFLQHHISKIENKTVSPPQPNHKINKIHTKSLEIVNNEIEQAAVPAQHK
jgi:hypothetical protein